MRRLDWRFIPIVLFLSLCLFFFKGLSLDPHQLPSAQIGKLLPQFTLPRLDNASLLFDAKDLNKRVVLLNVWASWCEACIEEQVFLMQLAKKGVLIYGLNYQDKQQDALDWLNQWGNPYQLIGQDRQGKVAMDLGVYGAPETFLIDSKGFIRYRHVGIMNEAIWLKDIAPLMKSLEQSL